MISVGHPRRAFSVMLLNILKPTGYMHQQV